MMQSSISAVITLDEVVNAYLDQHQLPQSKYRRIYGIAIRGWRLFYRDSTGAPKSIIIPVQANCTAVLPTDCLNKLSIGILNQRGEIASLTEDVLLGMVNTEDANRTSEKTSETLVNPDVQVFGFQDNLGYPGLGYGQYGTGSTGTIGFYRIDWERRLILFNIGFTQTEIVLEYIGMPDCDGDYAIHPFFQEALIAYINWQDSIGNPRKSKGERQLNEHDFNVQYRNARKAFSPFDPSDIYNQYRQGVRLAVKS